jgi:hypothetical protein
MFEWEPQVVGVKGWRCFELHGSLGRFAGSFERVEVLEEGFIGAEFVYVAGLAVVVYFTFFGLPFGCPKPGLVGRDWQVRSKDDFAVLFDNFELCARCVESESFPDTQRQRNNSSFL